MQVQSMEKNMFIQEEKKIEIIKYQNNEKVENSANRLTP